MKMDYEEISQLLEYNKDSGKLFWKVDRGNRHVKGKEAGNVNKQNGYLYVGVNYSLMSAHRLAWLLHYKEVPEGQIDHIDGCRTNNAIDNLRIVSSMVNNHNRKTAKGYFKTSSGKYRASIRLNYKNHHLGVFETEEEARAAYLKAKQDNGLHTSA